MTGRFTVLASGSAGNASLLEVGGYGLLIDCGLGPRTLAARLKVIGATWDSVHAVVLTHTHGDHWKDLTFVHMQRKHIPIYAHDVHHDFLSRASPSFDTLHRASLTRTYTYDGLIQLTPHLLCRPVWVSHDSDPTFAFRLDYRTDDSTPSWSIGYASDLGCGSAELIEAFLGVDVLALEYNHDEKMERNSTRPTHLIQRVLGDQGHLSNRQAAELTRGIVTRSGAEVPQHLVQLHLSRDCNHPNLAESAGRNAIADLNPSASVITASQDTPTRTITLARRHETHGTDQPRVTPHKSRSSIQPMLPGLDQL